MTLQTFTNRLKDELVAFFKARYGGAQWRQVVAIQADLHPRWFERWKSMSPMARYRLVEKLESFAHLIGFQSATDSEVQEAWQAHEEFKEAAAHEIEQCKRNERARGLGALEARRSL